jgi:basic membrane protein A
LKALRWLAPALLAGLALACASAPAAAQGGGGDRPSVVLVTFPCTEGNFICQPFRRALRRTGVEGRIVSPDIREDPVGTLSLLAQGGDNLVIVDHNWFGTLATVAPRFPQTRFGFLDGPLDLVRGRPRNVAAVELRVNEAAYLAGWLAARLERGRPGPDVVGAVGGVALPPVDDFIAGFQAGARAASPRARVLIDYSDDFTDATKCAAIARSQIARGAGTVFNVAGACGLGTLRAARRAGVWGVGVDSDQSFLGPHILTSVVKGYEAGLMVFLRGVRDGTLRTGTTRTLTMRTGSARLGRISPRVPAALRVELARVRSRLLRGQIEVPAAVSR